MPPPVHPRPPHPLARDLPRLLQLESIAFPHPGERFTLRQLQTLLRSPNACIAHVRIDGVLAGWAIGLLRRHGPRARSGRLYGLVVHPDFRGRRLGAHLANHVLRQLRRRGARSFSLEVRSTNAPAIRLYTQIGFRPAEPLPNYYGPGLHGLRMRKIPPTP